MSALGCGRVDEPPAPRTSVALESTSTPASAPPLPSESAEKIGTVPTANSPTDGPRVSGGACVVPWSETPATPVRPASVCPKPTATLPSLRHGGVVFRDAPGSPRISVELAQTPDQRSVGLMFRTSLDPNSGMLFSWSDQAVRSFWMHNTCLPLDMLFIAADGTISGILEQVPPMNDLPRSIDCPVRHVLEVNAGWCRAHGIVPGQRVALEE